MSNGTGLNLSDVANDLLLELCASTDYSIEYETGSTQDPDTGQVTPGTVETIQLDSAYEDTTSFELGVNSNIQAGDIFLMIPPKVVIPVDNFWVMARGQRYSVVNQLPFYNTGTLQYLELQLRRS